LDLRWLTDHLSRVLSRCGSWNLLTTSFPQDATNRDEQTSVIIESRARCASSMGGSSADQRPLAAQENLRSAGATQIAVFPSFLPVIFNASSNVLTLQRCWMRYCRVPFAMLGYDIISQKQRRALQKVTRLRDIYLGGHHSAPAQL